MDLWRRGVGGGGGGEGGGGGWEEGQKDRQAGSQAEMETASQEQLERQIDTESTDRQI